VKEGHSMAICLISGGMDSCVTAAMAKGENEQLAFLHISYGQRTETRERKAFNDIADFYRPAIANNIFPFGAGGIICSFHLG